MLRFLRLKFTPTLKSFLPLPCQGSRYSLLSICFNALSALPLILNSKQKTLAFVSTSVSMRPAAQRRPVFGSRVGQYGKNTVVQHGDPILKTRGIKVNIYYGALLLSVPRSPFPTPNSQLPSRDTERGAQHPTPNSRRLGYGGGLGYNLIHYRPVIRAVHFWPRHCGGASIAVVVDGAA